MDLNQFLNNLNWKKTVFLALLVISGGWMAREILFWQFFHKMADTYVKFNNQFEHDQEAIHNRILESEIDHERYAKEMDDEHKEFHAYINKTMEDDDKFMNKSAHTIIDKENLDQDKQEWEKIRKRYTDNTGKELPSFDELKNKTEEKH